MLEDVKAMAADVARAMRQHIKSVFEPLESRVGAVEMKLGNLPKPERGEKGDKGDAGASAYELARAEGFTGNKFEWLGSLQGKAGESIRGEPGKDGASVLVGEGPPLFASKPGDVYLDAKSGEIYRCED